MRDHMKFIIGTIFILIMQLGCLGLAAADKNFTERFTKEMADTILLLDSGKLKFKDWPIPNINSVYARVRTH